MRLIDYNEIRKLFDEEYKRTAQLIRDGETHLNNLAEGYVGADKVIRNLPEVDAVKVVRCKYCKYGRSIDITKSPEKYFKNDCVVCECEDVVGDEPMIYRPDHFCSYGKRRVEE